MGARLGGGLAGFARKSKALEGANPSKSPSAKMPTASKYIDIMGKQFLKRLSKKPWVQSVAGWLLAKYVWLVGATTKWHVIGQQNLKYAKNQPVIFAFWHNRIMMMRYFMPKNIKIKALISGHSDALILTKAMSAMGVDAIHGSANKGGLKAVQQALDSKGAYLVITPDGPKGPIYKNKEGIAYIAKQLNMPIIPAAYNVKRKKTASSWDKFIIAHPFNKGVLVVGKPILPQDTQDAILQNTQTALDDVTKQADTHFDNT